MHHRAQGVVEMSKFDDVMTEELVDELLNRFDNAVFIGRRNSEKGEVEYKNWHGDITTIIGLCAKAMMHIGMDGTQLEEEKDGFQ